MIQNVKYKPLFLFFGVDLINDFLEHLEVESGRSKKTVENYRLYLERFAEIAQEITEEKEDFDSSSCCTYGCADISMCG